MIGICYANFFPGGWRGTPPLALLFFTLVWTWIGMCGALMWELESVRPVHTLPPPLSPHSPHNVPTHRLPLFPFPSISFHFPPHLRLSFLPLAILLTIFSRLPQFFSFPILSLSLPHLPLPPSPSHLHFLPRQAIYILYLCTRYCGRILFKLVGTVRVCPTKMSSKK